MFPEDGSEESLLSVNDDLLYAGVSGDSDDSEDGSEDVEDIFTDLVDDDDDDDPGKPEGDADSDDDDGDDPEDDDSGEKAGSKSKGKKDKDDEDEEDPAPKSSLEGLWDPERQKRDQDHANERKSWESKEAELNQQLESLKTASKKADKQQDKDDDDDKDSVLEDLQKRCKALNEDSEADELTNLVKLFPAALSEARTKGEAKAVKALQSQIEALESAQATRDADTATRDAEAAQQAVDKEFDVLLARLDKEYGDHVHNDAYAAVQADLVKRGYSGERRPGIDLLEGLFEKHFSRLAAKSPKRKASKRKKGKVPASDPGTGGTATPSVKCGSLEGVLNDMYADGAFKP